MPRILSIGFALALTAVVASLGLTSWWPEGSGPGLELTDSRAIEPLRPPASTAGSPAGEARGTAVILRNNMPANVDVMTYPEGEQYRVEWGGGDRALGAGPIRSFTVVYHDPFWPYVYEVICPDGAGPTTIRMSDLWSGDVPDGFTLRRGRLVDDVDGVIWFSTSPGRGSTK